MIDEEKFQKHVQTLTADSFEDLTSWLIVHRDIPVKDERIIPYLVKLLSDNRPCRLSIPYTYGVIRWNAAKALKTERHFHGIKTPVVLKNVVKPMDSRELSRLINQEGIETRNAYKALALLIERGKAPLLEEYVMYPDHNLDKGHVDTWYV